MIGRSLLSAAAAVLISGSAFAQNCEADVQEIDQAMTQEPTIASEDLVRVQELRNQGAELCVAGQLAEADIVLQEAKAMLGLL